MSVITPTISTMNSKMPSVTLTASIESIITTISPTVVPTLLSITPSKSKINKSDNICTGADCLNVNSRMSSITLRTTITPTMPLINSTLSSINPTLSTKIRLCRQ